MAKPNTAHSERTSKVFRSQSIHPVTLTHIRLINPTVRTYVFSSSLPIHFLPGQWLDVHVPGHTKPGGYTITSAPRLAAGNIQSATPHESNESENNATKVFEIHLAIQKAEGNPVTEFLWHKPSELIGTPIQIRVGGSFTWPPPGPKPKRVVFVAGGVGINPLMSMLNHLCGLKGDERPNSVELLYGFKVPPLSHHSKSQSLEMRELLVKDILFLPELLDMQDDWESGGGSMRLKIFVTGEVDKVEFENRFPWDTKRRRMTEEDVKEVFDIETDGEKASSVGYVCGPPEMTDRMVQVIKEAGLEEEKVLCEKWW